MFFASVVVCHLQVRPKHKHPGQHAVNDKTDKSGPHAEHGCVSQIFEKSSLAHSVASLEDYWRQEKIEESFVIECKVLSL